MSFQLPVYHAPDFSHLTGAPDARFAPAPKDGVAPVGFHSTYSVNSLVVSGQRSGSITIAVSDCSHFME